jgi:hypothetical protein
MKHALLTTPHSLSSPRGPGEQAAAEQMQVQVVDSLAAVFAGIHDNAVAVAELFLAGNFRRSPQQMTEKRSFVFAGFGKRADVLARDYEDMHRRLRIDISESVTELVLKDRSRGDLLVNDLAKGAAHGQTSVHAKFEIQRFQNAN